MERVYHVDVVQVGRGRLVGYVHRMFEGKVPDRESLELGISRLDAPLVLLIELAKAHCHLAAARPRSRHDNQGLRGLDIVIPSETVLRVDEGNIVRVTFDGVVAISPDAHALQLVAEGDGAALSVVVGYHHGIDLHPPSDELVAQAYHVHVIGDPQVLAHLVLLYVYGADYNDNLSPVPEPFEHTQLAVGLESRQYTACVEIIE